MEIFATNKHPLIIVDGHKECAQILLGKGADVNHANTKGGTALHLAASEFT